MSRYFVTDSTFPTIKHHMRINYTFHSKDSTVDNIVLTIPVFWEPQYASWRSEGETLSLDKSAVIAQAREHIRIYKQTLKDWTNADPERQAQAVLFAEKYSKKMEEVYNAAAYEGDGTATGRSAEGVSQGQTSGDR